MNQLQPSSSSRSYVLRCAVVAALAGFLFGFDTIVISGADQRIQTIWRLDGFMHGLCMSAALWGTVLGAVFGGWPTERFGRRQDLALDRSFCISSRRSVPASPRNSIFSWSLDSSAAWASASQPSHHHCISPRFPRPSCADGWRACSSSISSSASSWPSSRTTSSASTSTRIIAWRWMLGVEAFPALLYSVLCFRIPESPRWLIVHGGQREAGEEVFRKINPGLSESEITATGRFRGRECRRSGDRCEVLHHAAEGAHPVGDLDCRLQPIVGHQRHPLFRTAFAWIGGDQLIRFPPRSESA